MKTNTLRFLLLLQVVTFSLQAQNLKVEQTKSNEFHIQVDDLKYVKMLTAQGLPEGAARSMMAANPAYFKTSIESIAAKFGSIDKFLEKEMELTKTKRGKLKEKFLY
ncbi:MAG: tyrosine-protein phosphatase [Cyclobacteriaceae bacterium]